MLPWPMYPNPNSMRDSDIAIGSLSIFGGPSVTETQPDNEIEAIRAECVIMQNML